MAPPPKKGRKAKSGNPAKRAKQEAEAARQATEQPAAPRGSAFGLGGGAPEPDAVPNLDELQKYLR